MPLFQVTCRERVYVDRIYEVEAENALSAASAIRESQGAAGKCIDEQVQDSYSFDGIRRVHDENGNVTPIMKERPT